MQAIKSYIQCTEKGNHGLYYQFPILEHHFTDLLGPFHASGFVKISRIFVFGTVEQPESIQHAAIDTGVATLGCSIFELDQYVNQHIRHTNSKVRYCRFNIYVS